MKEQIWNFIESLSTPGFFITAEIMAEGNAFPDGLESFLQGKLASIRQGIPARKFMFRENGWIICLTFFPTNQVVDERYALKNKVSWRR